MPLDILFDFAAVHVDGVKAADADVRLAFTFTDVGEGGTTWTVWLANGVLNAREGVWGSPTATVSGPKAAVVEAVLQPAAAAKLAAAGKITIEGDAAALDAYAALLDDFDADFPIVTPLPAPVPTPVVGRLCCDTGSPAAWGPEDTGFGSTWTPRRGWTPRRARSVRASAASSRGPTTGRRARWATRTPGLRSSARP